MPARAGISAQAAALSSSVTWGEGWLVFAVRAGLELLLMHPEKPLWVTGACLAHPSTHCTLAWACGELHFLGSPCWQGTCLSTLGSFL